MTFGVELESTRGLFSSAKAQEQQQEEGDTVSLALRLPNGELKQHTFKAGHTIAYVKLQIQVRRGARAAQRERRRSGSPGSRQHTHNPATTGSRPRPE